MPVKIEHLCDLCGSKTDWTKGETVNVGKISVTLMLGSDDVVCKSCRGAFLRDVSTAIQLKSLDS